MRSAPSFCLGIACAFLSLTAQAQISGNQVHGNENYYRSYDQGARQGVLPTPMLLGDTAIVISARVLLNREADSYNVTLALNQQAKTVKEANALLDKRIAAFQEAIQKLGVKEKDQYVDFISEEKLYDYEVQGSRADQVSKGFQIKKNLIINLKSLRDIDRLIVLASEQEIHDVAKVDYLVTDQQEIYTQLMTAAARVIQQKKDLYLKIASFKLAPVSRVFSESFYSVHPGTQYKRYQAIESSHVYSSSDYFVKKDLQKSTTFYYDALSPSGFDAVLGPASTVVGLQHVLELQIKFDIQKGK
jgi:uncharacterized protein YggE